MGYHLFPLHFDTPVRFGSLTTGNRLDGTALAPSSDTMISALCAELAAAGEEAALARFLAALQDRSLVLSAPLPWDEAEGAFYIPRPLLRVAPQEKSESYEATCQHATARKKQKKLAYIRASRMKEYFQAMRSGAAFVETNDFGESALTQHVNCRGEEPLPYFVGSFSFAETSGLYLVARGDADMADFLAGILRYAGVSGIGGKRSAGLGKFSLADDPLELDGTVVYSEDDVALLAMLQDREAPYQMAISSVLPEPSDIEAVRRGSYALTRAGGFVTDAPYGAKKNSVALLAAGSCFRERIPGRIAVLGSSEGHDILRAGLGLYVGITG